ncbi:MAG: peptide-methionine (S)-S-oxide reductase MsrA [Geopsychrobacter sp.]|nr:peptide-methionine (S)-S-oxide reductase MsrA [Geopsychrobacter sp.]
MEIAYFAAGCFWGIEKKFSEMIGVCSTAVGYMGGDGSNPTYEQVCSGESGHAETVKVEFDPQQISYADLLESFWQMHNPTCLNYQGWDIGTQYRSAIFIVDEGQRQQAEASFQAEIGGARRDEPIVTEIVPAQTFWRAEEYHQQYLAKRNR